MAGSLLWYRFDPWPRNFHILWVWLPPKKIVKVLLGKLDNYM